MCTIDRYSRYQKDANLIDFTPNISNRCGCGCGVELTGKKKRWASSSCADRAYSYFSIIKGNNSAIRAALFAIDAGYCRACGVFDDNWQADHVLPVEFGGGGCDISNLQTLCCECHKEKTAHQRLSHRSAISWHDASRFPNMRLYALGDVPKFLENTSIEKHPLLSTSFSV